MKATGGATGRPRDVHGHRQASVQRPAVGPHAAHLEGTYHLYASLTYAGALPLDVIRGGAVADEPLVAVADELGEGTAAKSALHRLLRVYDAEKLDVGSATEADQGVVGAVALVSPAGRDIEPEGAVRICGPVRDGDDQVAEARELRTRSTRR